MKPNSKKKPAASISELARQTGISRTSLQSWRDSGIDIFNPKKLAERVSVMKGKVESGSLSDAKLQKVLLECEKLQFAIDRDKGLFYPADQVEGFVNVLTNSICNVWKHLGRELPQQLDGVSVSKMPAAINRYVDEILIVKYRHLLETGFKNLKSTNQ